tara:strand:- start:502 stop:765 length:264 start_codon:yes stop_codon:yes gene_type:complete
MSDIEDLDEEINSLIDEIGDKEPTEEQEELLAELNEALEMALEIYGDEGDGIDDDLDARKDLLLDKDPAILADGEIDSWERWTQDYQ